MTPEQNEAFRREVLEEVGRIEAQAEHVALGIACKRDVTDAHGVLVRQLSDLRRSLAASQPAPAVDTGRPPFLHDYVEGYAQGVKDQRSLAGAADTGQAVAFERAGSDDAKLGWTLPVSLLQQVNQKVIADDWEDPTIEVTEIILLEAERLLSAHPAPLNAERVREACHDALSSLVAAVSLLKRGSKKAAPSAKMFDRMIMDYEAAIERTRAALRQKEGGQ